MGQLTSWRRVRGQARRKFYANVPVEDFPMMRMSPIGGTVTYDATRQRDNSFLEMMIHSRLIYPFLTMVTYL